MMDILIIINTFITCMVYIVIQIVVFRKIGQEKVIRGLFYVYILSGIFSLIMNIASAYFLIVPQSLSMTLLGAWVSFVLYTLLVFIYIMAIFGITQTSVRIRLLKAIYDARNGITIQKILKIYNRDVILKNRLERFIDSGEIRYQNGYYRRGRRITPYVLPDLIIRLFGKLYSGVAV